MVPFLREHLLAAHAVLRPALAELSVALVGDDRMADLHLRFLNIPGPTDVLTFPLDEDDAGNVSVGEVVVCVPEARRRSADEGTDPAREVLLYALHGMLHLCGHDDLTDDGYDAMHRAEDDLLTRLGVGPVFAATPTAFPGAAGAGGRVQSALPMNPNDPEPSQPARADRSPG